MARTIAVLIPLVLFGSPAAADTPLEILSDPELDEEDRRDRERDEPEDEEDEEQERRSHRDDPGRRPMPEPLEVRPRPRSRHAFVVSAAAIATHIVRSPTPSRDELGLGVEFSSMLWPVDFLSFEHSPHLGVGGLVQLESRPSRIRAANRVLRWAMGVQGAFGPLGAELAFVREEASARTPSRNGVHLGGFVSLGLLSLAVRGSLFIHKSPSDVSVVLGLRIPFARDFWNARFLSPVELVGQFLSGDPS